MDCTQNGFCKQLPKESREKLCAKCRRCLFKARSIQMREDYRQNCMVVLDGVFSSTTDLSGDVLVRETDKPVLYLGFPGRLLNLDITFGYNEMDLAFAYSDFCYLTDTWVASFSHHVIREFCDEDPAFRHVVMRNMVQTTTDACRFAALFRSNYTYQGLYYLIDMLAEFKQYLTQQQLAEIMNRDRTSVSKVISRIKKENPELWMAYASNKHRELTRPTPAS